MTCQQNWRMETNEPDTSAASAPSPRDGGRGEPTEAVGYPKSLDEWSHDRIIKGLELLRSGAALIQVATERVGTP